MPEKTRSTHPLLGKIGIVLGIAFLLAAGYGYIAIPTGFPDGYVSPFARETHDLRLGASIANGVLGLLGLACGAELIKPSKIMILALVLAFMALALPSLLLPSCTDLPGCREAYQTVTGRFFDDGGGG